VHTSLLIPPPAPHTPHTTTVTRQPAQVTLSGDAAVQQSVVFATLRPLSDATVHFEIAMHLGRAGLARLVLTFSYSLLQLLLRSPLQPTAFEEWRLLKKDSLPGMHVRDWFNSGFEGGLTWGAGGRGWGR